MDTELEEQLRPLGKNRQVNVSTLEFIKDDPKEFRKVFKVKQAEIIETIRINNLCYEIDLKLCENDSDKKITELFWQEEDNNLKNDLKKWENLIHICTLFLSKNVGGLAEWTKKLEKVKLINIDRLIEILGIERTGKFIHCPLGHSDNSPSCYVNTGKNYCYSFCCNKSLDTIELYKVVKQCTFKESVHDLYNLFYI